MNKSCTVLLDNRFYCYLCNFIQYHQPSLLSVQLMPTHATSNLLHVDTQFVKARPTMSCLVVENYRLFKAVTLGTGTGSVDSTLLMNHKECKLCFPSGKNFFTKFVERLTVSAEATVPWMNDTTKEEIEYYKSQRIWGGRSRDINDFDQLRCNRSCLLSPGIVSLLGLPVLIVGVWALVQVQAISPSQCYQPP